MRSNIVKSTFFTTSVITNVKIAGLSKTYNKSLKKVIFKDIQTLRLNCPFKSSKLKNERNKSGLVCVI
ncbi:MAG: hypothetical protein LBP40_00595 [Campylobacteraceae bacterium]|nr:hypothetical protein [Campylobacteraceae bacterium]